MYNYAFISDRGLIKKVQFSNLILLNSIHYIFTSNSYHCHKNVSFSKCCSFYVYKGRLCRSETQRIHINFTSQRKQTNRWQIEKSL